jgi:hypothetical protein
MRTSKTRPLPKTGYLFAQLMAAHLFKCDKHEAHETVTVRASVSFDPACGYFVCRICGERADSPHTLEAIVFKGTFKKADPLICDIVSAGDEFAAKHLHRCSECVGFPFRVCTHANV